MDPTDSNNVKSTTSLFVQISPLPAAANPKIFTITYTKGYHALLFQPAINLLKYSVTYQTDPYPCPFPSTHIDIF